MTEKETGCTCVPTCECRKCESCGGEGSLTRFLPPAAPFYREEPFDVVCSECNGSGQNRTDCEVHEDDWMPASAAAANREGGSMTPNSPSTI